MPDHPGPSLLPDAGPLITLAYADALPLLLAPGWPVLLVDMVFEDHKIARPSFLLPENCQKVSTRAFLMFLEQNGWIESAVAIERRAIVAGRNFSRLRFPPD